MTDGTTPPRGPKPVSWYGSRDSFVPAEPAEERKAKHAAEERVVELSKQLAKAIAERDRLADRERELVEAAMAVLRAFDASRHEGQLSQASAQTAAIEGLRQIVDLLPADREEK